MGYLIPDHPCTKNDSMHVSLPFFICAPSEFGEVQYIVKKQYNEVYCQ